jgi:glycosyltransferase involved in cell wall biosynthesis
MKKNLIFILLLINSTLVYSQKTFTGTIVFRESSTKSDYVDTTIFYFGVNQIKCSYPLNVDTWDVDEEYYFEDRFISVNHSFKLIEVVFFNKLPLIKNDTFYKTERESLSIKKTGETKIINDFKCNKFEKIVSLQLPGFSNDSNQIINTITELWRCQSLSVKNSFFCNSFRKFFLNNAVVIYSKRYSEPKGPFTIIEAIEIKGDSLPDSIFKIPESYKVFVMTNQKGVIRSKKNVLLSSLPTYKNFIREFPLPKSLSK